MTIVRWLASNWKIASKAIYGLAVGLLLAWGISTHNANERLSHELEMSRNNIEAYQGALNGSQQAFNVLKLDMTELANQNDRLIQQLDSVRKANKIKPKEITTAATQTQLLDVSTSKGVRGDIISILRDTIYTDTIQYNDLTKVYYSIGKDSIDMRIDLKNTQYLFLYRHREYKNKKSFLKRLFTLDFKKVNKYKYYTENTNDLIKSEDIRIIEAIDK